MLRKPFFILSFVLLAVLGRAAGYQHPGGMHPAAQITFVKKMIKTRTAPYVQAYQQLLAKADSAFDHEKHVLADFNVPGYYTDPEGHRKNSAGFQSDAFDAYACALAWQLSGKEKYARGALGFMMAWANENSGYSDFDGPLVMAYSGTAMVMAGELLYHYRGWSEKERQQFFSWVENVYLKACKEIRTRKNNWADWGRLGSVLCAHLLDNPQEMAENTRLIKSDLFHKIAPDGDMPEETRREKNGIWYTYFSLAPITAACQVIYQSGGENIFEVTEDGKSIKKALDYLFYYNQHPDEWSWFKDPRPGSPDSWPGNLFEAMGAVYGDSRYSAYSQPARPICYDKHHFAWSFPTLMRPFLTFEGREKQK